MRTEDLSEISTSEEWRKYQSMKIECEEWSVNVNLRWLDSNEIETNMGVVYFMVERRREDNS